MFLWRTFLLNIFFMSIDLEKCSYSFRNLISQQIWTFCLLIMTIKNMLFLSRIIWLFQYFVPLFTYVLVFVIYWHLKLSRDNVLCFFYSNIPFIFFTFVKPFTVLRSYLFYNSSNFKTFLISLYNRFNAKFSNNFGEKLWILLSVPYLKKNIMCH